MVRYKTLILKTPTYRRFVGVFSFRFLATIFSLFSSNQLFANCYGPDTYWATSQQAYAAADADRLAANLASSVRNYGFINQNAGWKCTRDTSSIYYYLPNNQVIPADYIYTDPVTGQLSNVAPPPPVQTSCGATALSTFTPPPQSNYQFFQMNITDYNAGFYELNNSTINVCYDTGLTYDDQGNTLLCLYILTTEESLTSDLTVQVNNFSDGPYPRSSANNLDCIGATSNTTTQYFDNQARKTSATYVDKDGNVSTIDDKCYETRIFHDELNDPLVGQTEIILTCERLSSGNPPTTNTIQTTRYVMGDDTVTGLGGSGVLSSSATTNGGSGPGGAVVPGDDIFFEPTPVVPPTMINGEPIVIPDTAEESRDNTNSTLITIGETLVNIKNNIVENGCSNPLGCEDFEELIEEVDVDEQKAGIAGVLDELTAWFETTPDTNLGVANDILVGAGIEWGDVVLDLLPTGVACQNYVIPLYLNEVATIECEHLDIIRGLLTVFMWISCGFFIRNVITRPRSV